MFIRSALIGAACLLIVIAIYLIWPVVGFLGETNPRLRNPFAWQTVPAADSCRYGAAIKVMPAVSEQACSLIIDHQSSAHLPSLSVAVAVRGEVIWSAAAGWADLDNNVLATPQTLYRIGSTSKPVTGTLMARMVDAGLVDLERAIGDYSGELPNPDWTQLTLAQLASHTAGMPGYDTNRDLLGLYQSMALRRAHTNVSQGLELFDGNPLRYPPGSDFEYSSFDTLLLAATLQAAGGRDYQALLQHWVVEPLGLTSPVPDQDVLERAVFYQLADNGIQPWRNVDLSNKLPGGGLMSRPEDLVKLGAAWLDPDFISPQTRHRFWSPQRLSSGEINEQAYALTWRWSETDHVAHHGGVSKGSMAWLAVYPKYSLVIAMATNTKLEQFSSFSGLQDELLPLFLGAAR